MAHGEFHVQVVSGPLRPLDRAVPVIAAVLEAGVGSVQLRDQAPAQRAMILALKGTPAWDRDRIVVNGEPRLAGEFGMPWLHLGASWIEQTPPFARFARIGISAHSLDEAIEAESLGADYVTFGNVYATQSHPGAPGLGIDALARVVDRLDIPVLAIGGINQANVAPVLATGCAGVAVISAVMDQADPGHAAQALVDVVNGSGARPKRSLPPMPQSRRKGSSSW